MFDKGQRAGSDEDFTGTVSSERERLQCLVLGRLVVVKPRERRL